MLKLEDVWMQVTDGNGENKEILRGVNLEFETGKLYGVTGPNGGGKTSLAKVIMGIYQQTQGRIYLDGLDISELSLTERARQGIGYAFQQPTRFKGLTVKDVLDIAAPDSESMAIRGQMRAVGLCPEDYFDRDLGPGLSGGEIKRIEVAQLLLRDTKVSIFDEPEAGVDLWTIQKLIALIVDGYKKNPDKLAIVISHNENILPICDEIIVIDDGVITGKGTADEIWHLIKDDIECKIRRQCQGDMQYEFK
ncbi:MAG: ATP-binding cassette domain-containing protein [Bacillota bacterium]|nr:ATP-binding cassette domain-containing protein [Bacillota bacterium]